jgi:G3E family GTPase
VTEQGSANRVPVTVLGGYLGSGKTTLLNHLLTTAQERLAVLVNDFGSINVDEALIAGRDGDTISLTNGCICCSLVDGFAGALEQVRAIAPPPDRLVIECSGVADPAAVAAWAHGPGLQLDGVLVVVDAERIDRTLRDEYVGDVIEQQLASADLLVLNKLDLVDATRAARAESSLAARSRAPLVGATQGAVPATIALGQLDAVGNRTPSAEPADQTHVAWSHTFATPPTDNELQQWMDALPPSTVRVKGVIEAAPGGTGTRIVHRVGPRWTVENDNQRTHAGPSILVGIDVGGHRSPAH